MVAAALRAGSDTSWSEDMQHGMTIGGRLRVADPFRAAG
jgi:predicted nucleic acid-binding protein